MKEVSPLSTVLAVICGLPVAGGMLLSIWRNRRSTSPDRLIAATIATMPLLMPYYLDYDLLLLALPAVLFAAEMIGTNTITRRDLWIIRLFAGLFVLLMVPSLTRYLAFSLVVPCLVAIAILLMKCVCDKIPIESACAKSNNKTFPAIAA